MSVRVVPAHRDARPSDIVWSINGELELRVRHVGDDALVSLVNVRKYEWKERVYELLQTTAAAMGMLRRVDPMIDCLDVVVPSSEAERLIDEVARHRFGTRDYEQLTATDALCAVLGRIEAAGGSLGWDQLLDDMMVEDHFPLGYRFGDAVADLQQRGAFDVIRKKGRVPTLRLNDVSRRILAEAAIGDGPGAG
jgi:hypothetical protein